MNEDVIVLLLGATEGAYALAASFAEYGVRCAVMDETVHTVFDRSALVGEVWRVPGIAYRGILLRALNDFYEKYAGKCLILLPATEDYGAQLLAERQTLETMYILPQKHISRGMKPPSSPVGLLLSYVGATGRARTFYGEVVACTETEAVSAVGEPLAVITSPVPPALVGRIATGKPHFALYAVTKDGSLYPYTEDGSLSPLVAFPSAADASLAEWILADYVLCSGEEASGGEETPEALYALSTYQRIKPYLSAHACERVGMLHRNRLCLSLYRHPEEKKNPFFRLCLHRYAKENWQKRTKIKK